MSEHDHGHGGGITLHFCALCNESIPQSDLDAGRVVRHKDRLICASCDRAMSVANERAPVSPSFAPPPVAVPRPVERTREGSGASGVLVAVLALFVAIGGVVWVRWQRERDRRFDEAGRAAERLDLERRLDSTRSALDAERAARAALEQGLVAARAEVQRVASEAKRASEDEALKFSADLDAVRAKLASVETRLGAAVSPRDFDALRELAVAAREELGALSTKVAGLEEQQRAPVAAAPAVETPAVVQPKWFPIVQKLKSPDLGVRWSAVQELAATGDVAVVEYLVPILQDQDAFVRMMAARELGNLGSTKAVDGLIAALGDERAPVREESYLALRKLTKKDLPFDSQSDDTAERQRRIKAWLDWWKKARENTSTS